MNWKNILIFFVLLFSLQIVTAAPLAPTVNFWNFAQGPFLGSVDIDNPIGSFEYCCEVVVEIMDGAPNADYLFEARLGSDVLLTYSITTDEDGYGFEILDHDFNPDVIIYPIPAGFEIDHVLVGFDLIMTQIGVEPGENPFTLSLFFDGGSSYVGDFSDYPIFTWPAGEDLVSGSLEFDEEGQYFFEIYSYDEFDNWTELFYSEPLCEVPPCTTNLGSVELDAINDAQPFVDFYFYNSDDGELLFNDGGGKPPGPGGEITLIFLDRDDESFLATSAEDESFSYSPAPLLVVLGEPLTDYIIEVYVGPNLMFTVEITTDEFGEGFVDVQDFAPIGFFPIPELLPLEYLYAGIEGDIIVTQLGEGEPIGPTGAHIEYVLGECEGYVEEYHFASCRTDAPLDALELNNPEEEIAFMLETYLGFIGSGPPFAEAFLVPGGTITGADLGFPLGSTAPCEGIVIGAQPGDWLNMSLSIFPETGCEIIGVPITLPEEIELILDNPAAWIGGEITFDFSDDIDPEVIESTISLGLPIYLTACADVPALKGDSFSTPTCAMPGTVDWEIEDSLGVPICSGNVPLVDPFTGLLDLAFLTTEAAAGCGDIFENLPVSLVITCGGVGGGGGPPVVVDFAAPEMQVGGGTYTINLGGAPPAAAPVAQAPAPGGEEGADVTKVENFGGVLADYDPETKTYSMDQSVAWGAVKIEIGPEVGQVIDRIVKFSVTVYTPEGTVLIKVDNIPLSPNRQFREIILPFYGDPGKYKIVVDSIEGMSGFPKESFLNIREVEGVAPSLEMEEEEVVISIEQDALLQGKENTVKVMLEGQPYTGSVTLETPTGLPLELQAVNGEVVIPGMHTNTIGMYNVTVPGKGLAVSFNVLEQIKEKLSEGLVATFSNKVVAGEPVTITIHKSIGKKLTPLSNKSLTLSNGLKVPQNIMTNQKGELILLVPAAGKYTIEDAEGKLRVSFEALSKVRETPIEEGLDMSTIVLLVFVGIVILLLLYYGTQKMK